MLTLCLSMIPEQEDKDKFEKIYEKYKGLVTRITSIYMEGVAAEDASQETFIKLIGYIDKLEAMEEHKSFSFVRLVTRSVCFDERRKEKAQRAKEEALFQLDRNYTDNNELYKMMERIMSLPAIYSDTLMLKYYHGFDEKEISNITKVSKETVYKRLSRAKILLKEDMR